jgi:putative transcriptional regulator
MVYSLEEVQMIKNRLRVVLAERGSNLNQLADSIDVHYTSLWRFAQDETGTINKDTLDLVCQALEVQPGDIFVYVPEEIV